MFLYFSVSETLANMGKIGTNRNAAYFLKLPNMDQMKCDTVTNTMIYKQDTKLDFTTNTNDRTMTK